MAQPRADRLETRWDETDGFRIFSRCTGGAGPGRPAVVLVHGLSMSSLSMAPTARRLARDYRVYALDMPGYGRSQEPRERLRWALTIEQQARILGGWLDQLGIERADFIGNSLGCQIIVELAVRNPERVRAAVLTGPSVDPRARSIPAQMARGAIQLLFEPLAFWGLALFDYLRHGVGHTFQALGDAIHDPIQKKLPAVQAPVLVVRGSRDTIVSQAWAAEVARLLARGTLAVIPKAGHLVPFDAPDALAEQVLAFLLSLEV